MHAPSTIPSADERFKPLPGSPRGAFVGAVKENRHLCTDHYRLVLAVPGFPASAPGQFVQLDCRDPHAGVPESDAASPHEFTWPPSTAARPAPEDPDFRSPIAYLRRPFSIADHRITGGTAEIDIMHRVVGRGTQLLKHLQPGDTLSLLGPLGIGFQLPADLETACLVGGGVGIPPMLYLAKTLAATPCKNRVAFFGAQRHDLMPVEIARDSVDNGPSPDGSPRPVVAELNPHGFSAAITTDDGSLGMKGFVTQALQRYLESRRAAGSLARTVVCCCGPTPMMKATARVATSFGVPCLASLEQPMACGMGTCQSCIIRYRPHDQPDADWKYKLTCTHGPVFDSRDIMW